MSDKLLVILVKYSLLVKSRNVVFNATFNHITAISWRSVLLVEETGGAEESHRPAAYSEIHKMFLNAKY